MDAARRCRFHIGRMDRVGLVDLAGKVPRDGFPNIGFSAAPKRRIMGEPVNASPVPEFYAFYGRTPRVLPRSCLSIGTRPRRR